MNWLDVVLAVIIGTSVVSGLLKGFARVAVGMAAVVLGLLLGIWFYGAAGSWFRDYVSAPGIANFLGFIIVFGAVLAAGGLVSWMAAKLFKWAGLQWLDRVLGGALGLLRGLLVAIGLLMVIMAFTPKPPPSSVVNSRIAPYVIEAASMMTAIAPRELKDGFRASYDRVKQAWSEMFERGTIKPRVESQ